MSGDSSFKIIQISKYLSIDPLGEGRESIYEVQPGKIVELEKIQIIFPPGTNGELKLALYYGELKVAPNTDYWEGDSGKIEDILRIKYYSDDEILIYYKNISSTDIRKATIKIDAIEI